MKLQEPAARIEKMRPAKTSKRAITLQKVRVKEISSA
jgi:hypothetical protein